MPGSIHVPNQSWFIQQLKRKKIIVAKWDTPKTIKKEYYFSQPICSGELNNNNIKQLETLVIGNSFANRSQQFYLSEEFKDN